MNIDIEVVAGIAGVLAEETCLVCFVNSDLEMVGFLVKLSSNIDVGYILQ